MPAFRRRGFEVGGIALAVLPLVLSAFSRIRKYLDEYANIDYNINRVLLDVKVAEGIFQTLIDDMLSRVILDDMRKEMKKDLRNDNWTRNCWNQEMRDLLGNSYITFKDTVQGFHDTMSMIENVLRKTFEYSSLGIGSASVNTPSYPHPRYQLRT